MGDEHPEHRSSNKLNEFHDFGDKLGKGYISSEVQISGCWAAGHIKTDIFTVLYGLLIVLVRMVTFSPIVTTTFCINADTYASQFGLQVR